MAESYEQKFDSEKMTSCSLRTTPDKPDRAGAGKHCRSANDVEIGESYSIKRPSDDTLRV